MERHEALILIIKNLSTIIEGLEQLKGKIKPVLEEKGWNTFEVGVDLAQISLKLTGNIKPCDYHIIVYDNATLTSGVVHARVKWIKLTSGLVHAWVKSAVTDYQGYSGVKSGAIPYPADSFLGLEFLKDLRNALSGGSRKIINNHSGYKHSSVIPN